LVSTVIPWSARDYWKEKREGSFSMKKTHRNSYAIWRNQPHGHIRWCVGVFSGKGRRWALISKKSNKGKGMIEASGLVLVLPFMQENPRGPQNDRT